MKNSLVVIIFFTIHTQAQVLPVAFMKSSISFNYATVAIGGQEWMTKNLDVVTYRNGDPIPEVTDQTTWENLTTGAWCYYNNDPANGAIYGKLYNWYAVMDPRELAPAGSHIPSLEEFKTLGTNLGGNSVAGGKLKATGTTYWASPNSGATNESGFSALPGGMRIKSTINNFFNLSLIGFFWTTTSSISNIPLNAHVGWVENDKIDLTVGLVVRPYLNGCSVRCIKN